jgi:integrase
MFSLAIEWDLTDLKKNPAKGIKSFEENNKLERYITPQQALALNLSLNESENPSLKFIVALLLVTGARKQEALQAKWQDIDFNANVWRIPVSKSGKVRYIPLSETAQYFLQLILHQNLNILGSHAEACPYVFPNPKTLKPFTTFFYSWHTARCKAGLPDV